MKDFFRPLEEFENAPGERIAGEMERRRGKLDPATLATVEYMEGYREANGGRTPEAGDIIAHYKEQREQDHAGREGANNETSL